MATVKLDASSPLPQVQDIVMDLSGRGQRLEYAVLDTTAGRIIGYKPVGQLLVILPPPRNTTLPAELYGNDPAMWLNTQAMNRELTSFANAVTYDPRWMWFTVGAGVLVMALLYSRKRK